MDFEILRQYIRVWILLLMLILGAGFTFVFMAESQMNAPGSVRDTEYWENVLDEANVAGDLMPLSGYLHQRVAEMMAAPRRNIDALLTFAFMDRVLQGADPLRPIPDLRYALAVYRKQLFLSHSSVLRFYYSILCVLSANKKNNDLGSLLTLESKMRVVDLQNLREIENTGDWQKVREQCEKLLTQPEFASFQTPLMLKLAYLFYEKDPAAAKSWIKKVRKKTRGAAMEKAADYLANKLSRKSHEVKGDFALPEQKVIKYLKSGLFEKIAALIAAQKEVALSEKMVEIQSWLSLSMNKNLKVTPSIFSRYFAALGVCFKDPNAAVDLIMQLSKDDKSVVMGALLRYQAWSLAYFDAKNYRRAFFISGFLKVHDPLSPYSQFEAIKGMYKPITKTYTGEKLLQIWKKEPYRFDMLRKDDWIGFKMGGRVSEVAVHEGHVYFAEYDSAGKAKKLKEVSGGEKASTRRNNEVPQSSVKMSWIDKFFYNYMAKFVPMGVLTFKEQVFMPSKKFKNPVFERFYSQEEFQTYVLDKMRPALGTSVKSLQSQIREKGFSIFGVVDLKLMTFSASGEGKLVTVGADGQLILRLDHAKLGHFYIPQWVLRRVEKSFNVLAENDETFQIDILDMQYQSGGIRIKCRKKID